MSSSVRRRLILESASNDRALNGPLPQNVGVQLEVLRFHLRVELRELHGVEDHVVIVVVSILVLRKSVEALDHVGAQGPPLDLRALVGL